jgi:hypothetical protein
MIRIGIAIGSALALAAGAARATDDKSPAGSNAPTTGASTKGTSATGSSASTTSGSTTSASAATPDAPVSGDVASADAATMVITIVLPSGDQQQLNVANDAQITRDGSSASVAQLQQGDNVRASFDPSTHKASKLEAKSKTGSKSKDSSKKSSGSQSKPDDQSQGK